jgi:hypothetical protein
MEPITTSILASCIYDLLKHSAVISAGQIKGRLKDWAVSEMIASQLEGRVGRLNLNSQMSELAIEVQLSRSQDIIEILSSIKPSVNNTISQTHSGIGDNVAGDKITKA